MPSSAQVVTTVTVFDYEIGVDGKALVKAQIEASLNYDQATLTSPAVILESIKQTTTTDSNGYWQLMLVANSTINPANTTYLVKTPQRSFQIAIPAGAGPFQASSIATTSPPALAPAGPFIMSYVRAHQSAASVSLAGDSVGHVFIADVIDDNPDGNYSGVTGAYTVKVPGRYLVTCLVIAQQGGTPNNPSRLVGSVWRNGTELAGERFYDTTIRGLLASDSTGIAGAVATRRCVANDTLSVALVCTGPNAVTLVGASAPQSYLAIDFLGG